MYQLVSVSYRARIEIADTADIVSGLYPKKTSVRHGRLAPFVDDVTRENVRIGYVCCFFKALVHKC